MLRIQQVKIKIDHKDGHTDAELIKAISKQLNVNPADIASYKIVKRSIDARKKPELFYIYTFDVQLDKKLEDKLLKKTNLNIKKTEDENYYFKPSGTICLKERPIIIGAGPAGLFCAYFLAKSGYAPIVVERGAKVEDRIKIVEKFWETGCLDQETNVQFGEGGAGTFSDGKLNTQVKEKSGRIKKVLETFVANGAPDEIMYINKPHIGTDNLRTVVKNIREEIIRNGGEFRFNTKVTDILTDSFNNITGCILNGNETVRCSVAVLAIGHSSRDTFEMLEKKKLIIEPKPFAIGVRVEHKQDFIGRTQYGEKYDLLPAADYKLTYTARDNRGVYSFCMCPGGYVVNASSENGRLVVNGMSDHARDSENANSAIVVTVNENDYKEEKFEGPLCGMYYQRKWEEKTFNECNGAIVSQRFSDFVENRKTTSYGDIKPCHKGITDTGDINKCLPLSVCHDIKEGISGMSNYIKDYSECDPVLSGIETRTSSPIRIVRNEQMEAMIGGLYPCGEGPGYAGGIVSAAVDGIKVYEAIASKYMSGRNVEII